MADRIIRLFEPILIEDDGTENRAVDGFWDALFSYVKAGYKEDPTRYDIKKSGNPIKGKIKRSISPSLDYLYVGRDRKPEDFPDHRDPVTSNESHLKIAGELVEPSYLIPVKGTSYISLCRTSAGPRSEAISSWLTNVVRKQGRNYIIELRPVMRGDALKRLRSSEGVQRVFVKVLPGSIDSAPANSFKKAVSTVKDKFGSDTYVGVEVSYGNATADQRGSIEAKHDLEKILMSDVEIAKAEATLRVVDDRGVEKREHVMFSRDAFTESVKVSPKVSEFGRESEILSAMIQANERFIRDLISLDKVRR